MLGLGLTSHTDVRKWTGPTVLESTSLHLLTSSSADPNSRRSRQAPSNPPGWQQSWKKQTRKKWIPKTLTFRARQQNTSEWLLYSSSTLIPGTRHRDQSINIVRQVLDITWVNQSINWASITNPGKALVPYCSSFAPSARLIDLRLNTWKYPDMQYPY